MSSFTEEMNPDTMEELVEYDRIQDFIDGLNQFPESDWRVAHRYYKRLQQQGTVLNPKWKILFRVLRM